MKLRIRGNSIRLRLLKAEINALGRQEQVVETTRLGPDAVNKLTYIVATHTEEATILTNWVDQTLRVTVRHDLATQLAQTDKVSLSEKIVFQDEILKVLIEKDFKCLTVRTDEDESDNFQNPQESHLCGTK